jgi:hypothetical protein
MNAVFMPHIAPPVFINPVLDALKHATKPTLMGTVADEAALWCTLRIAFSTRYLQLYIVAARENPPDRMSYSRLKTILKHVLFPDWKYKNAAAVRRLALEHYVYSRGDKHNETHLMRQYINVRVYTLLLWMDRAWCVVDSCRLQILCTSVRRGDGQIERGRNRVPV